jgi:4-hydroxybenzoate polyprenyltransferase
MQEGKASAGLSGWGRWGLFLKTRFPLYEHMPVIFLYYMANAMVAERLHDISPTINREVLLGFFVVLLVFFHLRLFDDMKDYGYDREVNGERPLALGVISLREAKGAAAVLILAELVLGRMIGPAAFQTLCGVIIYSVMMYKEFFIGKWLRPRLATYALTHTLIASFIALFIASTVTARLVWGINPAFGWFVLTNWFLFNIFEFARKTMAQEEEREGVASYSQIFGPFRAAAHLLVMEAAVILFAFHLGRLYRWNMFYLNFLGFYLVFLLEVAIVYVFLNNRFWAKCLRTLCSLFLIVYNLLISLSIIV